MSAASLGGLEPIAAAAAGGGEPIAATAAGERVQQLQTLLEQVEQGPAVVASKSFASALDAAQTEGASSATAGASVSSAPLANATYTSAIPTTVAYGSATPVDTDGSNEGATYAPMIEQAAARYGIDPSVLYGLIEQESGFDPSATSSAGAQGLTQLMPSTAASLGVTEPLDPAQSIEGGARYLSGLLRQFGGNTADALAAYNAGPGAVEQYGGVPPYPETQQYVAKVLGYAASYSQSGQDAGALPSTTSAVTGATATAAATTAPTATPSEAIV
jgi:soluble lytic murein transglycosylase-like protein